jgi:hypothetical protein
MSEQQIQVSGIGSESLAKTLAVRLTVTRPSALGIASAFVSVPGIREMLRIVRRAGISNCRLIAGISNAVTHPESLNMALANGWDVRLGINPTAPGIFHPKLIVAGNRFDGRGNIRSPSFTYIGSSNITYRGLRTNIECGLLATEQACPIDAAVSFAKLWRISKTTTANRLRHYADEFALRNRRRSVEEIEALGISDSLEKIAFSYKKLRQTTVARSQAIPVSAARAAWAGLESFTGEYRFQVEFPRTAGEVLQDLVDGQSTQASIIPIYCTTDRRTLDMQYKYYSDNAMFRLNIPNDIPGVRRARSRRNGIALVEVERKRRAIVKLTILPPGRSANQIVQRSVALGTWGKTTTRLYGWF